MEPRQSAILYVRTSDKVLLRFADIETARRWIETRRLSLDDEYFATDQTWQPLSRLFRVDLPPRDPGSLEPDQVPTVPFFPEALTTSPASERERTVHVEGPTRVFIPSAPSSTVPGTRPETAPRASGTRYEEAMQVKPTASARDADIWGTEPDAPGLAGRHRRHKALVISAMVAVAVLGLVGLWWARSLTTEETTPSAGPNIPPSAPQPPAIADRPATAPSQRPTPTIPVPAQAILDPGPSASDAFTTMPPEVPASRPLATSEPSRAPLVVPPTPHRNAPATAPTGAPSANRAPDDMGYDQHMAEGSRWLARDLRKAMAHFQAASVHRPGSVEPRVKMAECEYRLGRYREALALFQRALDMNPNYGPAIIGLARTHQRLGNTNDARFWYLKYLESNPHGSQAQEARAYLGR